MEVINNIDMSILNFIYNNLHNIFLDTIMPFITTLGNNGIIWIFVVFIFLLKKKYWKYGIVLMIALLLCQIIGNDLLKPLFGRARPFDINQVSLLIVAPKDFSFPSGHTMAAFASFIVILRANKKYGIGALILAIFIGFSRLYLYVHYPSDVLAGALIGILIGLISFKIFPIKNKKK